MKSVMAKSWIKMKKKNQKILKLFKIFACKIFVKKADSK